MRNEVLFAGLGGQGIIKAALLLAQAAGLYENREVAQTQSYGPEARGGACKSEVVISDAEIDYIKTRRLNALVVMSQPALDKYRRQVSPETTIVIYDPTLIGKLPPEFKLTVAVPATAIAEQEFGQALFANIIMLGALSGATGLVALDSLEKTLPGNVPPRTLKSNQAALRRGYEAAQAAARQAPGLRALAPPV